MPRERMLRAHKLTLPGLICLVATFSFAACESKKKGPSSEEIWAAVDQNASGQTAPGQTAPGEPTGSAAPPSARPKPPVAEPLPQRGSMKVVGPALAILPGRGIGPVRFGATPETVERLMAHPCDRKDATACDYYDQAVRFEFTDGVVSRIAVQRRDRPITPAGVTPHSKKPAADEPPEKPSAEKASAEKASAETSPRFYGTFNGALAPDLALGMHQHVIVEALGPPKKVEKVEKPGPNGTFEVRHYDGIAFEFDHLKNGNDVLGAVVITPFKDAKSPVVKATSTTVGPGRDFQPKQ